MISKGADIRLVIGIDPGSRITGYGLVVAKGEQLTCLKSGQVQLNASWPLERRLASVFAELSEIIQTYKPQEMAVEDIFFARNARSALSLGHVRGVALLAAAQNGLDVRAYSPNAIKKSVVGYGRASKDQVNQMVRSILGLRCELGTDVTDALACAICHLNTSATRRRLVEAG